MALHIMQLLPPDLQTPPAPDLLTRLSCVTVRPYPTPRPPSYNPRQGAERVPVAPPPPPPQISLLSAIVHHSLAPREAKRYFMEAQRQTTKNCFRFGNYLKRLLIAH